MKLVERQITTRQQARLHLPVEVVRLYNYSEPIEVRVVVPESVKGVQVTPLTLPAGQFSGNILLTAAADATPGVHKLKIEANGKFNNQNWVASDQLLLTLEPAEGEKKN